MSSIIKKLESSRRIQADLALDKCSQDIERNKLERQLNNLSLSRRNYIANQLETEKKIYESKLLSNTDIGEEHLNRKKREAAERARIAQQDFERERERLIKQRNLCDELDKTNRAVEKKILDLKAKSRISAENQNRAIAELNIRKQTVLKLIAESRERQLYHYEQSKKLSVI